MKADTQLNESPSRVANRQYHVNKVIQHLKAIRDICRKNGWYASASYSSMAADSLFHMMTLGDKAQRPDMLVTLTDIHFGAYPDESEDPAECD